MTQRKHVQQMIEFANNPEALAFVKMGTIDGTEYYILVDYPLWKDDKEYVVRTDMTLAEAQADRAGTIKEFEAHREEFNDEIDTLQAALNNLRV